MLLQSITGFCRSLKSCYLFYQTNIMKSQTWYFVSLIEMERKVPWKVNIFSDSILVPLNSKRNNILITLSFGSWSSLALHSFHHSFVNEKLQMEYETGLTQVLKSLVWNDIWNWFFTLKFRTSYNHLQYHKDFVPTISLQACNPIAL